MVTGTIITQSSVAGDAAEDIDCLVFDRHEAVITHRCNHSWIVIAPPHTGSGLDAQTGRTGIGMTHRGSHEPGHRRTSDGSARSITGSRNTGGDTQLVQVGDRVVLVLGGRTQVGVRRTDRSVLQVPIVLHVGGCVPVLSGGAQPDLPVSHRSYMVHHTSDELGHLTTGHLIGR